MVTCGSPARRMRASSSARGGALGLRPAQEGERSSTLAAWVGQAIGSPARAAGARRAPPATATRAGRATSSTAAPGRGQASRAVTGTRTSSKVRAMRARLRARSGTTMPTEASGSRSRIDLAQCAAARISSCAPGWERSSASPSAPSGAWISTRVPAACNASSSAARCGSVAVEPVHDQMRGRGQQATLRHQSQAGPRAGRRRARASRLQKCSKASLQPRKARALLAQRVAAQRLGQPVRAHDAPGFACGLRERLPVQQRASWPDSATTRSHRASSCCEVSSRGSGSLARSWADSHCRCCQADHGRTSAAGQDRLPVACWRAS